MLWHYTVCRLHKRYLIGGHHLPVFTTLPDCLRLAPRHFGTTSAQAHWSSCESFCTTDSALNPKYISRFWGRNGDSSSGYILDCNFFHSFRHTPTWILCLPRIREKDLKGATESNRVWASLAEKQKNKTNKNTFTTGFSHFFLIIHISVKSTSIHWEYKKKKTVL